MPRCRRGRCDHDGADGHGLVDPTRIDHEVLTGESETEEDDDSGQEGDAGEQGGPSGIEASLFRTEHRADRNPRPPLRQVLEDGLCEPLQSGQLVGVERLEALGEEPTLLWLQSAHQLLASRRESEAVGRASRLPH